MTKSEKKYPYAYQGPELKTLRGSIKVKDYAKTLGVAPKTYYRYEKGERKVPDGLLKLARILSKNKTIDDDPKIVYKKDSEDVRSLAVSEKRPPYDADNLLDMAKQILNSGTNYGIALATNIRTFYDAIKKDKLLSSHEQRHTEYEQRLADLEKKLSNAVSGDIKAGSGSLSHTGDAIEK